MHFSKYKLKDRQQFYTEKNPYCDSKKTGWHSEAQLFRLVLTD